MNCHLRSLLLSTSHYEHMISIPLSVLVHVSLLVLGAAVLVKPADFGVESGFSSIEVELAAAVPPEQSKSIPSQPEVLSKIDEKIVLPGPEDAMKSEPVKPVEIKKEEAVNKPLETSASTGAITQIKPAYLKNPAPIYPQEARRLGQEGLVVLEVNVDRKGKPASVKVKESSGHDLLDHAALRAVRQWTFAAARIGELPVEATVNVPVRFKLESL